MGFKTPSQRVKIFSSCKHTNNCTKPLSNAVSLCHNGLIFAIEMCHNISVLALKSIPNFLLCCTLLPCMFTEAAQRNTLSRGLTRQSSAAFHRSGSAMQLMKKHQQNNGVRDAADCLCKETLQPSALTDRDTDSNDHRSPQTTQNHSSAADSCVE